MKVKFWGTRGSIAVPGKDTIIYGGNTCCLDITLESGKKIIIDAGTGIRPLGDHLIASREKIDILLLLTHIHWDHILGFPFFDPVSDPASRISVDGAPMCMKGLAAVFDNKMGDGFFPVKFEDLKARIRYLDKLNHGPLKVDGTVIDAIPLNHPQGGFGFRFQEGKKKLVFITDNELAEDAPPGRRPEDYARFCKGADVLIHDSQFIPDEIPKHRGWGHSDYAAALNLALKAHVKQLTLFHHAPSRKDPDLTAIIGHCEDLVSKSKADITIDAAREGTEFTL